MQDGFFEWDDDKAERNPIDHDGVTFMEARSVFQSAPVEIYDEDHSEEEGRYAAMGFSPKGRLLFVVFTPRGKRIRIISAWPAGRNEEQIYEQNT